MKNLLPFIFCAISFCGFAQVHSAMPPEAIVFYNNAMRSIKPAIKDVIQKNANKLRSRNINPDSLNSELKKDPLLKGMNQKDVEAITVLIMVQASKNADSDLKNLVIKMRKTNDSNYANQDFNGTETILEHKSKIAETVAVAMEKISGSQENSINNLK